MRVQNPDEYAEVLLGVSQPEEKYTAARIRSMYGSSERMINFKRPIPVYITYQTAFADDAGKPQARADIYGLDRDLLNDPARRPPQRRHADRAQLQLEQQAGHASRPPTGTRRHASELRPRNNGYGDRPGYTTWDALAQRVRDQSPQRLQAPSDRNTIW